MPTLQFALAAFILFFSVTTFAATPGFPFSENYSNDNLKDATETSANWSTETGELLLNKRRPIYGAFANAEPDEVDTSESFITDAEAGDIDGDGDLDLVVSCYGDPNLVLVNNGIGGFTQAPFIFGGSERSTEISLGDVDRDGDLDMVVANDRHPSLIHFNDGFGAFGEGVPFIEEFPEEPQIQSLELADFNGDGWLDIVVGSTADATPSRLYLNDGAGNFPHFTEIGTLPATTGSFAVGDLDGDGDLDLVAGNVTSGTPNHLYVNNGTANPFAGVSTTELAGPARMTQVVALADLDGDGDLDLVAANRNQFNQIFFNQGNGVFATGVTIPGDETTYGLALGDINNDGAVDILIANEAMENRVHLNDGAGGFDETFILPSTKLYTRPVVLADFDCDGDLDAFFGNRDGIGTDGDSEVLLNQGTPNPFHDVQGVDVSTDAVQAYSGALGDLDRDGDLDLVVGAQPNRYYLNDGAGNFGPQMDVPGIRGTFGVALGDINRDGYLDLTIANSSSQDQYHLNNGGPNPFTGAAGVDISSGTSDSRAVTLGDFNGDGGLDLVFGPLLNGVVEYYLNNAGGNPFTGFTGTDLEPANLETLSVASGDVNGDGWLDVVSGNRSNANRLYLNAGFGGGFLPGTNVSMDALYKESVRLADVDGDGDLDLIDGGAATPSRLYRNDGTGVFGPRIGLPGQGRYVRSLLLVDVDKDGDLDLIQGVDDEVDGRFNRLLLNNGDGTFTSVWDISTDTDRTWGLDSGDLDRDGDDDLVAINLGSPSRVYKNLSSPFPIFNGGGIVATDVSNASRATQAVALGDINGDGVLDIVSGNLQQTPRFHPGDGDGGFDPPVEISKDDLATRAVALGDVDRNGTIDVVTGNQRQPNRVHFNDGTGKFLTEVDVTADIDDTFAIALADMDGDGDLDLVAGNDGQKIRWYLNDGMGGFAPGEDLTDDAFAVRAVAAGDVNGDSYLDLIAGVNGQANRLYINNGDGKFQAGVDITADAHATSSVALGDLDADGDPDLVVGNLNQPNRVYLNNGAGVFGPGADVSPESRETRSVALADIDCDGDLDLITGELGQTNQVHLNGGSGALGPGIDLTQDEDDTTSLAAADLDRDGDVDIVAGTEGDPNRVYLLYEFFDSIRNKAASIDVHGGTETIPAATLSVDADFTDHAMVEYWMSNNGGGHWVLTQPDVPVLFRTTGLDLRWKAILKTAAPVNSPRINQLVINPTSYIVTDPDAVDFGDVVVGPVPSSAVIVSITNAGNFDLNISGIIIGGTHQTDFLITEDSGQMLLPPGNVRTVSVVFDPFSPGPRTASLAISSDYPSRPFFEVPLSGIGINPPTATPTPTITETPTITDTPTEGPSPTATATSTVTNTATHSPTLTETATEGPSPTGTQTTNYDVEPQPTVDGMIDARDLLEWVRRIGPSGSDRNLLFDFARFWKSGNDK